MKAGSVLQTTSARPFRRKFNRCSSEALSGYSSFPREIAIKVSLGKVTLPEAPSVHVPSRLASQGMKGLAIEHAHALRVASLPRHHRDRFDRLVVAQSQIEKRPIVTVDEKIAAYDVEAIWAGHGEAPWDSAFRS